MGDPDTFTLDYKRTHPPRKIDAKSEAKIIKELKREAEIIRDNRNLVRLYNYSYLKEILEKKHKVFVSLPTIIRRAKKLGIIGKELSTSRRSNAPSRQPALPESDLSGIRGEFPTGFHRSTRPVLRWRLAGGAMKAYG